MNRDREYDFVVAGGGTAGCVIASRLSEDSAVSVLLVEAGPDYWPEAAAPRSLREIGGIPARRDSWNIVTQGERWVGRRRLPLPRTKVVGGCSRGHLGVALRASDADFAEWEHRGVTGWSLADVMPYYVRLAGKNGMAGELTAGLYVTRHSPAQWSVTQNALLESSLDAGHRFLPDANSSSEGVCSCPIASTGIYRANTAVGYLTDDARARSNLSILSEATVDRIAVRGERAKAVEVIGPNGTRQLINARRGIVLTAGVFGSPCILLRSGLGPSSQLRSLGICPTHELPRVGAALQDHPLVVIQVPVRTTRRIPVDRFYEVLVKATSGSDSNGADVHVLVRAAAPLRGRSTGPGRLLMLVGNVRPRSLGRVALSSRNPHELPLVEGSYLRDPRDRRVLEKGLEILGEIAKRAPLSELVDLPVRSVAVAEWKRHIAKRLTTYQHSVGTCAIGRDETVGVVDSRCRVHGVDNLWIGDASIMPVIPRVNTLVTTVMIAERCSDFVKSDANELP